MRPLLLTALFVSLSLVLSAQDNACNEAGSLSRETYVSTVSGRESRFHIYIPPCYASSTETYPLLTLLHGSNADDWQWALLGFLQTLEAEILTGNATPMIVLMPYGGAAANDNSFSSNSYEKVLLDLLAQVSARYRTNGTQAIGGISRGGFWAYHLGLRYADKFVAVGGHSPFFDDDHVPEAYNPLNLAQTLTAGTHLKLWLDRGTLDYAASGVDQMHVKLQERDVPHQFVVYPGGDHSEATWAKNIGDYVAFYSNAFSPTLDLYPTKMQDAKDEFELWLPVAGFGTLLLSIDSTDLDAVLAGGLDERLMLTESAAGRLRQHGLVFHEWTRIVPYDRLFYELWRNKHSYTLLPFDELRLRLRPLWLDDLPIVDQLERYPLVFKSEFFNFSSDKLTRITLSGTTALARHTLPAIDEIGIEQAASGISEYVQLSDFFQITNEASIVFTCPDAGIGLAGRDYSMCMKPEHARLFELLDVDVVDLTGNHINDFRFEPLLHTLDVFEQGDIAVVGGGRSLEEARKPLILEHNGSRVGWLACNWIGPAFAIASDNPNSSFGIRPGAASCDPNWLREALALLAAEVDLVLMTVQYREYEKFEPEHSQVIDFQTFAEWGADIVVGTAEHKPMTFEFYPTRRGETAFIHYGLGNLFFDQLGWGSQRFFLDTLYIYDGRLLAVEVYPGIIEDRARPRLLTGEDRFNFLHFMFIQRNKF